MSHGNLGDRGSRVNNECDNERLHYNKEQQKERKIKASTGAFSEIYNAPASSTIFTNTKYNVVLPPI
jgi:hypothetical protein